MFGFSPETIGAIIIAIITSGLLTLVVSYFLFRKKHNAEAGKIEADAEKAEAEAHETNAGAQKIQAEITFARDDHELKLTDSRVKKIDDLIERTTELKLENADLKESVAEAMRINKKQSEQLQDAANKLTGAYAIIERNENLNENLRQQTMTLAMDLTKTLDKLKDSEKRCETLERQEKDRDDQVSKINAEVRRLKKIMRDHGINPDE